MQRMIAQIGVEENVESTIGYEVMNEGFARDASPRTAEIVTMMTRKNGRKSPRAFPMTSAKTFTATVQLPFTWIGIMNSMMPTMEGARKPASCLALNYVM